MKQRRLSGVVPVLVLLSAAVSCNRQSPGVADRACAAGQRLLYTAPGCGLAAKPVCGPAAGDGCASAMCGCDGQTIYGCGGATRPFASYGACDEGGRDAAPDVSRGMDGGEDSGCPQGQVRRYVAFGCGEAAQLICTRPVGDACASPTCACDGTTLYSCGPYDRPVAHEGACPDAGADRQSIDGARDNRITCCPIETPGCSCFAVGGTSREGVCPRVCDAGPNGWTPSMDENGCVFLVQQPAPGDNMCLRPPQLDAHPDSADAISQPPNDGGPG